MGCVVGLTGVSKEGEPMGASSEQISLTFGLAIMVAVQCFGHISGAHINPIITVAAATMGNIPWIQMPIYFIGQFLGGLAGFGLLKLVTPSDYMTTYKNASDPYSTHIGVCSPELNPNLTQMQGLLVEFIASLILTLVCCSVWDGRNNNRLDSVALRIGFTISVLAMTAGPYTGANLNPARSLAPALINGYWDHHWIYWIGPLAAGFVGGLFYRFLFSKDTSEQEHTSVVDGISASDKS